MDEVIKEIYASSVKAQEREIDIIKNSMDFMNWLFGIASTLLFSAVVATKNLPPQKCCFICLENLIIVSVGVFAFVAIACTFYGKYQGYNSIRARIRILTLLDIKKFVFLKPNPPQSNPVIFSKFEYLPEAEKNMYISLEAYGERKNNESRWLFIIGTFVGLSLSSMLLLLLKVSI